MGYIEHVRRRDAEGNWYRTGRLKAVPWNAAAAKRGPSKVFDRESEADAYIRRVEREIDGDYEAAGVEVTRQARRVPFAEYVVAVAESAGGELSTRRGAKVQARQLGKVWPTQMIDEIDRPAVRALLASMRAAGMSSSTQRARLVALRRTMAAAVEDRLRDDDPTVGLVGPPIPKRHHRILTADELERAMAALPPWLRAAALLTHDAGLRIEEIAGLRWHRIDLLHRRVEVADVILEDGSLRECRKDGGTVTIPLTARLTAALDAHRESFPAGRMGHVFGDPARSGDGCPCSSRCTARRPRLTTDRIRTEWERARAAAKLEEPMPRWHDLRHSCATYLALAGASAAVIQAVLGHADPRTSQAYIDRTGMATPAAAYLAKAFGGPADQAEAERDEDASWPAPAQ